MKTEFIKASKYREIERTNDSETAVMQLMRDVGSEGELITKAIDYCASLDGQPGIIARISDVNVMFGSCVGMIRGEAYTKEDALKNLLKHLLDPHHYKSLSSRYEASDVALAVGERITAPNTIVKIEP